MTTAGPITTAEWLEITKPHLERIADRQYQERSWFSPKGTSPTEFICQLMDDLSFGKTSQAPWLEITAAQKASCLRLAQLIDAFVQRNEGRFDPRLMLNDPEWDKIRVTAKELLKELYP